jgi:tetratricopeptide (TPR) repeat protein
MQNVRTSMNLAIATDGTTSTQSSISWMSLGKVSTPQEGMAHKALVRLRRAFESDSTMPTTFLGLAITRAERKWDQASELCEIAVELNPKEIRFHLNLGEVYASAGLREKALDKLDHAP